MTAKQLLLAVLWILGSAGTAAFGGELGQVVLLATDPAERKAVMRVGDGELQVLEPGDAIEGTGAVLDRVLAGRVVVRETLDEEMRRLRRAWIYPRDRAAGVAHIRYLEPSIRAPAAARPPPPGAPDSSDPPGGG